MATQEDLRAALAEFAGRFAAEPRLKQMTQGWDRTIEVRATDLASAERLRVEGGVLTQLDAAPAGPSGPSSPSGPAGPSGPAPAEIVMEAGSDLLCDLFRGRIGPTEPYMSGELILRASEQDVMRIDVVTLMIWGE